MTLFRRLLHSTGAALRWSLRSPPCCFTFANPKDPYPLYFHMIDFRSADRRPLSVHEKWYAIDFVIWRRRTLLDKWSCIYITSIYSIIDSVDACQPISSSCRYLGSLENLFLDWFVTALVPPLFFFFTFYISICICRSAQRSKKPCRFSIFAKDREWTLGHPKNDNCSKIEPVQWRPNGNQL